MPRNEATIASQFHSFVTQLNILYHNKIKCFVIQLNKIYYINLISFAYLYFMPNLMFSSRFQLLVSFFDSSFSRCNIGFNQICNRRRLHNQLVHNKTN